MKRIGTHIKNLAEFSEGLQGRSGDDDGSEIRPGTNERESMPTIRKQDAIRTRNEERVGLILTWRKVSSVVFQLKFLYCQKPRRRQEHNGSSNMERE